MFYLLRMTIIIVFSLFALFAQAQNSDNFDEDEIDCESETLIATMDLRYCAMLDYKEADKELNEVYKELIAAHNKDLREAKAKEDEDFDHLQVSLNALRQSQRDWIKFRDGFCEYEANKYWGGTMMPLVHTGCLTLMTKEQTKRLRDSLEW